MTMTASYSAATLSVAEVDALVSQIGAPVAAPLAMPKQVLEMPEPLSLRRVVRAVLARLHLAPAARREM